MSPLHNLLKGVLMPVCLAAVAKQKKGKVDEKVAAMSKVLANPDIDRNYRTFVKDMFLAFEPGLTGLAITNVGSVLPLYSVVYKGEKQAMVYNSKNSYVVFLNGSTDQVNLSNWSVATKIQVEEFLDKLTPKAIQIILGLDELSAILAPLFEETTELVLEDVDDVQL